MVSGRSFRVAQGARGVSGVRLALFGSTTQLFTRGATCLLLTVRWPDRGEELKFVVLVLAYDDTIAVAGVLDRSVRQAIAAARDAGIVVVLATGRTLSAHRRSRTAASASPRSVPS